MRREAVVVFVEEMWEEVVAEQLVDLENHGRLSKEVEKKVNKILRGNTPNIIDKILNVCLG